MTHFGRYFEKIKFHDNLQSSTIRFVQLQCYGTTQAIVLRECNYERFFLPKGLKRF